VRQGYGRLIQTRRGRTPDSAHIVKGYIRALRAVADKQSGQLDEMETKVNAMLDEMRRFTDA
jgi:hypothetical protein